jgi:hypothetical protein
MYAVQIAARFGYKLAPIDFWMFSRSPSQSQMVKYSLPIQEIDDLDL